jgi:multisubunit Na+/H+ antiporter MnhG subunit
VVLRFVTSPIESHMVGRAAFRVGQVGSDRVVDELADGFPRPGDRRLRRER